ncbi:SPFH domain-containing protein [Paenibacillus urinalis]|uniref:SPFH domain-containing protein n=1 Tax=Paenibacillus urinalis TaxID=521520 RepID=A0AAX3MUQ4_9BACL|nr:MULTISPECIES: SPFH domain-containing protein [Paenibacillus]WDH80836.1 SPFH domain-containing protein [Paenibacillus urinalis]WDH96889.1 SPFH domain-containing protein [Paenibacillus urinalis]WDI00533.1 SPFH domain-containing protein [Paenibacillus urinalis]GAK39209.1 band 7 family protein [Paenibacillus sp. TCA20]
MFQEKKVFRVNGFVGLLVVFVLIAAGVFAFSTGETAGYINGSILAVVAVLLSTGMTVVQPNQAMVLTFFGKYMGVIRDSGFYMTIPLSAQKKVSLRVRNFNSSMLKVNDVEGNPIEIEAVVVFSVVDSAKALFEVDDYESFVEIQSETALRHVASKYAYDNLDGAGFSLRSNAEEIAMELTNELQARLEIAGVNVRESRLTHLAYSTEIASAMLQRQQASAIISAREKIVEGAVTMVQLAIERLEKEGAVELDEERKAAMINNLLVAVVSDRSAQPVINTSTIY